MVGLLIRSPLGRAALLAAAGLAVAFPAAAGDPARGKVVFSAQCASCHSAAKGGAAILGPTLFGVVGRTAGTIPGFAYSKGMKASGFVWSQDQLKTYLPAPKTLVPGTKMSFNGLKNATQVDDIVTYLATLK